jgi:hypothetical protein
MKEILSNTSVLMLPIDENNYKNSGSSTLAQMISIYKHIMGDSSSTKDLANALTE